VHDLIIFKDAVICDLITVGSEPPCLHILHFSRPAGPLEEALADIEFQNSGIRVLFVHTRHGVDTGLCANTSHAGV